jgi:Trm5-related predicted tRNA methylase
LEEGTTAKPRPRVEVAGVLVSGVTVRTYMWLTALVLSWVRGGVREKLGSPG